MMELRQILKEHRIALLNFASLINVGDHSLRKYEQCDETLRPKTKAKIEHGLRMLQESGIFWPDQDDIYFAGFFKRENWWREVNKCNAQFRKYLKDNGDKRFVKEN